MSKSFFILDADLIRQYAREHSQSLGNSHSEQYKLMSEILALLERETPKYTGLFFSEDWRGTGCSEDGCPQQIDDFLEWDGWPNDRVRSLEKKFGKLKHYRKSEDGEVGLYPSLRWFITEDVEKYKLYSEKYGLPTHVQDCSPSSFLISIHAHAPAGRWKAMFKRCREYLEAVSAYIDERAEIESLIPDTNSPSPKSRRKKPSEEAVLTQAGKSALSSALFLMFAAALFGNRETVSADRPGPAQAAILGGSGLGLDIINDVLGRLFLQIDRAELRLSRASESQSSKSSPLMDVVSTPFNADGLLIKTIPELVRTRLIPLTDNDNEAEHSEGSSLTSRTNKVGTSSIPTLFADDDSDLLDSVVTPKVPNEVIGAGNSPNTPVTDDSTDSSEDSSNPKLPTTTDNGGAAKPPKTPTSPLVPKTPTDTPGNSIPDIPPTTSPTVITVDKTVTPDVGEAIAVIQEDVVAVPGANNESEVLIDASATAISNDGDAEARIDVAATALNKIGNARASVEAEAGATAKVGDALSLIEADAISVAEKGDATSSIDADSTAVASEGDATAVIEATAVAISQEGDAEVFVDANAIANAKEGNALALIDVEAIALTSDGDAKAVVEAEALTISDRGSMQAIVDIEAIAKSDRSTAQAVVDVESLIKNSDGDVKALVDVEAVVYSDGEGAQAIVNVESSTTYEGNKSISITEVSAFASGENASIEVDSRSKYRGLSFSSDAFGTSIHSQSGSLLASPIEREPHDASSFDSNDVSDDILFGGLVGTPSTTTRLKSIEYHLRSTATVTTSVISDFLHSPTITADVPIDQSSIFLGQNSSFNGSDVWNSAGTFGFSEPDVGNINNSFGSSLPT